MMEVLGNIGIGALKPELFLVFATIILLLFGLYAKPKASGAFTIIAIATVSLAAWCVLCPSIPTGTFLNSMFVSNAFTIFAKILILLSAGLVLMLSSGFLKEEGGRPFEFVILILFATLGMMLMVSAGSLLTLYMALEMSSLALYVLASFSRDNQKSNEAGLKYFVLGSLASGMMLFGMSLVYGFAGSINFSDLGSLFAGGGEISKGVILGLVLIIVGFCFKLSAVPFHMWTPDVYEGSPTPVTAFFATAPKIAALVLLTRVLLEPFATVFNQWQQIIIFASVASLVVGALGGIMQTNIKRLIAYSAIGYVGFLLMGLASGSQAGVQAMLIYMSLYIFMCIGMFGCMLFAKRGGVYMENLKDLSGLSQTNPALAIAISICIFSMAGIPPLSGFFGKFYVILATIQAGLTWLAVAGVIASVVACYYYLKIIKMMYFDEPLPVAENVELDISSPLLLRLSIVIGVSVTMLFFVIPTPLITATKIAAMAIVK